MKYFVMGILAHVDAGKTTLSEQILLHTGVIRQAGRVDHQDTFLDTDAMEKERGITIFSKQAVFPLKRGREEEWSCTLLDTPGHVDFSPEMERTLQVLDIALLLISAPDGVNAHVESIWRLLEHYKIPTFFFINKTDQVEDTGKVLKEIRQTLTDRAADFERYDPEEICACDDELTEAYLEGELPDRNLICKKIAERKLFPVFCGSALKDCGIKELLEGIGKYASLKNYPENFGAKVFKITRENGQRLAWMKITGGSLKVRQSLRYEKSDPDGEKITDLRVYSGSRYTSVAEAFPGMIVAAAGLKTITAGTGLGYEKGNTVSFMQPIYGCSVLLPDGTDRFHAFQELKKLEEEEPMLRLSYDERTAEISAQVFGEVQIEIFTRLIWERLGLSVKFGPGKIVYKETIAKPTEGVGHFEPLRHYAEVHLLLEPGEPGSGLCFSSDCPTSVLGKNWQRLILTHLQEKKHYGVLTGAPITDMKITLIGGKAHEKHTEGGDFRQATYRALRQGLMMAENVLLEPVYDFVLKVPAENLGRALTDLQNRNAVLQQPDFREDTAIVRGTAAAAALGNYSSEVIAYTHGAGNMEMSLKGYEPCSSAEEIIAQTGYDPDADEQNPSASVFCSHGVGTIVPWDKVRDYMHVDTGFHAQLPEQEEPEPVSYEKQHRSALAEEEELRRIFERTYGPIVEKRIRQEVSGTGGSGNRIYGNAPAKVKYRKPQDTPEIYLLVDGYNIIYAWNELRELAGLDIKAARDRLMEMLSAYAACTNEHIILVFDAYKVPGGHGSILNLHNMSVVYTRQAETADLYIEKTSKELVKKYRVRVASSDLIEQVIIFGAGAERVSAAALKQEMEYRQQELREKYGIQ